jgi:hypothetical protein
LDLRRGELDGVLRRLRGPTAAGTQTDNAATSGRFERGDPAARSSSGAKQLGTAVSGVNDGTASNDNSAWATATGNLSAYAGQTVQLVVEAADLSTAGLVEAPIDDVRITKDRRGGVHNIGTVCRHSHTLLRCRTRLM